MVEEETQTLHTQFLQETFDLISQEKVQSNFIWSGFKGIVHCFITVAYSVHFQLTDQLSMTHISRWSFCLWSWASVTMSEAWSRAGEDAPVCWWFSSMKKRHPVTLHTSEQTQDLNLFTFLLFLSDFLLQHLKWSLSASRLFIFKHNLISDWTLIPNLRQVMLLQQDFTVMSWYLCHKFTLFVSYCWLSTKHSSKDVFSGYKV